MLFTTPTSAETEITTIKVGLTYCECPTIRPAAIIPNYPSFADFQISLYSTSIQSGARKPDVELYKIPMQLNLQLTGVGTEFTFDIPNWRLERNTTYALVGGSTDTKPVKWANIKLGVDDYPPQPQNGFSFNSSQGFVTNPLTPTVWQNAGAATNNSVEMKFVYASSTIPTLSERSLLILALLLMSAMVYYGRRHPIERP